MTSGGNLKVVCRPDYEAMSQAAVERVFSQLQRKPDSLVILPTGSSPERTYELLVERARQQPGLCDRVRLMKLDEWGGLEPDDPGSCEMTLQETVAKPLGLGPGRLLGWRSNPADVEAECERIRQLLAQEGPPDLCILGIGLNGHLGLNEPGATLIPGPHRAELLPESRGHSMLRRARREPEYGLTLGIGDILASGEILLLVSGRSKQEPLQRLLKPEVSTSFPASFLWLHPKVTVYCDEAALQG